MDDLYDAYRELEHRGLADDVECECHLPSCYQCRRRQIDERALYIYNREIRYCAGMTGFDIEEHAWKMADMYRYPAIRELAFEFAS